MLKNFESITRVLMNLAVIGSIIYGVSLMHETHQGMKQLMEKVDAAFEGNRVTIALEMKLPEGSKNDPTVDLTSSLLRLIAPKNEAKPKASP